MGTVHNAEKNARERAIERIRRLGKPVTSIEALYGPPSEAEDAEDLEAFLTFLQQQRQARSQSY